MSRICVCDTNDFDIELFQIILESGGHDFVPAFTVEDARSLLMSDDPYDLFCVDLQLPGLDRREMTNALKMIYQYVPVLGLSDAEPQRCTSLVMAQFFGGVVTKPFEPIGVLATIDSLLAIGRIRDRLAARAGQGSGTRRV